jgi:hypothetical protein
LWITPSIYMPGFWGRQGRAGWRGGCWGFRGLRNLMTAVLFRRLFVRIWPTGIAVVTRHMSVHPSAPILLLCSGLCLSRLSECVRAAASLSLVN